MARNPTPLAILLGLVAPLLLLAPAVAQIDDYSPQFTVEGLVAAPRTYTIEALRALPSTEVAIQGLDELRVRSYRGVSLHDLLLDAEPRFDPTRPTEPLSWYVVVSASEERSAVLAWGEIDPWFEGKPVIVAYEMDGQPLPTQSGMARLVVPFDRRATRGIANIRTIAIQRAEVDAPPEPRPQARPGTTPPLGSLLRIP